MPKRITKGNLWGFIQSRPYASVSDIRRLFTMDVDGAAVVPTVEGTYYIGLPQDVADLIGQLWQEGRIVLDTNPDVRALVVQGIYPARVSLGRQGGGQGGGRGRGGQGGQPRREPRPTLAARAPFEPAATTNGAVVNGAYAGHRDEGGDGIAEVGRAVEPGLLAADGDESGGEGGEGGRSRRRRRRRRGAAREGGSGETSDGADGGGDPGQSIQSAQSARIDQPAAPAQPAPVG